MTTPQRSRLSTDQGHRAPDKGPDGSTGLVLASSAVAAGLSAVLLSPGVVLTPDGWAYWEGSVSILSGLGYRYFGGQPITDFPPLFSLFLSSWQAILGVSGRTLALALLFLAALSSGVWVMVFLTLLSLRRGTGQRLLLFVFVPAFLATNYRALVSETLGLLLLGLLCLVMARRIVAGSPQRHFALYLAWTGLLSSLLLLCRNSALAFIPGVALFTFWSSRRQRLRARLFGLCAVTVVPVAVWHIIRVVLGQTEAAVITRSAAPSGPIANLLTALDSLGLLVGPDEWGIGRALLAILLGVLAVLLRGASGLDPREESKLVATRLLVALAITAWLTLGVLFSLTWVHDPLAGRFLWFLPPMLIGAAISLSTLLPRGFLQRSVVIFIASIVLVQTYRTAFFLKVSLRDPSSPNVLKTHAISPDWIGKPQRQVGRRVLISPPEFPWVDRGAGTQVQRPERPDN